MTDFSRLTETDLERLKSKGLIREYRKVAQKPKNLPQNAKKPHSEPVGLAHIKEVLEKHGILYETEHKFSKRKFRFDVALLQFKLYIEYDGLMSKKSRHTTATGFSKDQQKFNLATINGWVGFRYSPLNYEDFNNDLVEYLFNKK